MVSRWAFEKIFNENDDDYERLQDAFVIWQVRNLLYKVQVEDDVPEDSNIEVAEAIEGGAAEASETGKRRCPFDEEDSEDEEECVEDDFAL